MTAPSISKRTFDHSVVADEHMDYSQALGERDQQDLTGVWPTPNLTKLVHDLEDLVPKLSNNFQSSLSNDATAGQLLEDARWSFSVLLALLRFGIEAHFNERIAQLDAAEGAMEDFLSESLARSTRRWVLTEAQNLRLRVLCMELDLQLYVDELSRQPRGLEQA